MKLSLALVLASLVAVEAAPLLRKAKQGKKGKKGKDEKKDKGNKCPKKAKKTGTYRHELF